MTTPPPPHLLPREDDMWRHWFIKCKLFFWIWSSVVGYGELCVCFSQSESGKYFEWITVLINYLGAEIRGDKEEEGDERGEELIGGRRSVRKRRWGRRQKLLKTFIKVYWKPCIHNFVCRRKYKLRKPHDEKKWITDFEKMRKFLAGFIEKLMIPGMTLYSKMRLFVVIVSNSKPFTLETLDYRIAYIVQSKRVETQMSSQSKQSWTAERNISTHIQWRIPAKATLTSKIQLTQKQFVNFVMLRRRNSTI